MNSVDYLHEQVCHVNTVPEGESLKGLKGHLRVMGGGGEEEEEGL